MKPPPFTYRRAGHVQEAIEHLEAFHGDAKLIAGGQSLVPMLNFRLARPAALVDIGRLGELRYARRTGDDELRIGALTLHETVERLGDHVVGDGFEVLRPAARLIGHPPIRARGTFGGSIVHADPASEWCMLALLLDARMVLHGPDGERVVAADDFFRGYFTTAAGPFEILTEVRLRRAGVAALHEFARRHGDFATVAVAVAVDGGGARVVVGGVEDVPRRATEAEAVLAGRPLDADVIAEAAELAARQVDPVSDLHATAEHRRELTATLTRRALEEVRGRC
jgi:carbon-monoxide dehydrogenase medium subunit